MAYQDIKCDKKDNRLTSKNNPYQITNIINIVNMKGIPIGKLSIAMAPGKKDNRWNRDLDLDLKKIKEHGVNVIVCLLEWREMKKLNITDYPKKAEENGFLFFHLPITDCDVPMDSEIKILVPVIKQQLICGRHVLVHCREGLGRAGTISACCLLHFGYNDKMSINMIRNKRCGSIQNKKQENFIINYYNKILNI